MFLFFKSLITSVIVSTTRNPSRSAERSDNSKMPLNIRKYCMFVISESKSTKILELKHYIPVFY